MLSIIYNLFETKKRPKSLSSACSSRTAMGAQQEETEQWRAPRLQKMDKNNNNPSAPAHFSLSAGHNRENILDKSFSTAKLPHHGERRKYTC